MIIGALLLFDVVNNQNIANDPVAGGGMEGRGYYLFLQYIYFI